MVDIADANFRLLTLAERLETLPDEPPTSKFSESGFYMGDYNHHCGTPACALGHARVWGLIAPSSTGEEYGFPYEDPSNIIHWGHLFGCEHKYRTAREEARIIREFVAMRAGGAAAQAQRLIGERT